MKRRVEKLKPFAFSADFSAPAPETADTQDMINMTASDLAALLAEAREATAEMIRDETLHEHSERVDAISRELRVALGSIVELAAYLEKAAIDEHDRQTALESIRRIAGTLIDGQGELFTQSERRS